MCPGNVENEMRFSLFRIIPLLNLKMYETE